MSPLILATKPATSLLWAATVLILLQLSPGVARADLIIGNLATANGANRSITNQNRAAYSFTMGSQAYSLSDVQVTLGGTPPTTTSFRLESNSSGHPSGSVLLTFVNPTFSAGTKNYTFLTPSSFTLTANTTYWLVGLSGNTAANWVLSNPQTNPSGVGATFVAYALSGNSGTTWTNNNTERPKFQIDGTVANVPEPSSLVLVGTAACVAAATGWRRRRTRSAELAVP